MADNESSSAESSPHSRFAHNSTVRAWVEALFPAGEQLAAPNSAKVADSVNRYFDSVPGLEAAIGALLRSLEMRFWLSHGRSFAGAPLKQRRAFIETHGDSVVVGPLLRDVGLHKQPGCWLRSSHSLKECVIAHWSSDPAPKIQRG